uniref:Nicotinamide N-methyltransferase-like n=1 Tax=Rhabditophanes sp. KR3021 TaxID=114890 RepID=A0AC35TH33_9BILA
MPEEKEPPKLSEEEECDIAISKLNLYDARDHASKFVPQDYLEGFYSSAKEDIAMQIVLFFVPGIIYRLPESIENMLDLGAGPTVYIPIATRTRVKNVFTSDYAEANREALKLWIDNDPKCFDWTKVCEWLATIEANFETPKEMQDRTRQNMRAVLDVDVYEDNPIKGVFYKTKSDIQIPQQFDLVSTIFCLEYATETLKDYQKVVKNAISLLKPGGYLLQGGVLEATEYSFGQSRFKCFKLEQYILIETLKNNGMETDVKSGKFKFIEHDTVFILISQKKINKN